MSALPPKADIADRVRHVRFVPKADIGSITLVGGVAFFRISELYPNVSSSIFLFRTALRNLILIKALFGAPVVGWRSEHHNAEKDHTLGGRRSRHCGIRFCLWVGAGPRHRVGEGQLWSGNDRHPHRRTPSLLLC